VPIDLIPIVYWMTQKSEENYADSLANILRLSRGQSRALLVRHAAPERSGRDPETLIYLALWSLQCKLLDQYLPPISASQTRSVGQLWPWWKGMKLRVGPERIFELNKLPAGNGVKHTVRLPDGEECIFRFYANDSEDQRRYWLFRELEDEALREKAGLGREQQIDDDVERKAQHAGPQTSTEILEWIAITDPDDWREASSEGGDAAKRKRRQRAKGRLEAARSIRDASSQIAKAYYERLRAAPPKDRRSILDEYSLRHAGTKQTEKPS
jgi:hypothetical protein